MSMTVEEIEKKMESFDKEQVNDSRKAFEDHQEELVSQPSKIKKDSIKVAWKLADAINAFNESYPLPLYVPSPVCIPGIGDVFIRKVGRLGHKGEFPRPYDWENLVPQLQEGEELLWIIRKHGGDSSKDLEKQIGSDVQYPFEVYFGLKFTGEAPQTRDEWEDRGRRFMVLSKHFAKSAFPESQLECGGGASDTAKFTTDFLEDISGMEHVRFIAGMPSIKDVDIKDVAAKRDDDVRPYAGLNDFLEMHDDVANDFAVVLSVSRVSPELISQNFNALFTIQNTIQPLMKEVVQFTEGTTVGWSFTANEGSDDQVQGGDKEQVQKSSLLARAGRGMANLWRWFAGTPNGEVIEQPNLSKTTKLGVMLHHGTSKGESKSEQSSRSWSVTKVNSALAFVDDRIKEYLLQLTQTLGTGGYSCAAAVFARGNTGKFTAESVSGAICATLSGGHSAFRPMRVYRLASGEANRDWLLRRKTLGRLLEEYGIQTGIMNCEKACLFLPVPTTHLAGLPLKKNVFYGKANTESAIVGDAVELGSTAFGEVHIKGESTRFLKADSHHRIGLSQNDFYSHMFIVGTTGSGKTHRAAKILHDADGFRRVILETAKKTYWNELGLKPEDVLIYTLGDSTHKPFRINPFYFEPGTSLKQHISVLADAISDLLPMEALIGPKLREAVERCYEACGWNIETSLRDGAKKAPEYPDVTMFYLMVRRIAKEMSDYSAEVQGNYTSALLNRAAIFMDAVYQDIFAFDGNKTIDQLLPADKTVIIEMEELPPSEINMPAFVISLLLHRIRARQNLKSKDGTLKEEPGFLIAIEEAHNVLARDIQSKQDERQSGKGGHLVKQVTRLLAEGRGLKMGLIVIDQSSANIAPSVITNTNTKLVFRQEDGTEIETIGKAIGLDEDSWSDLQLLGTGECLLRNEKFSQPIKMARLPDKRDKDKKEESGNSNAERDKFVPESKWIPQYRKMLSLLHEYCNGDALRLNDNGKWVFDGYDTDRYKPYSDKIVELCGGHDDLIHYIQIKALIDLRKSYAITSAESESGI